jgi:hypothetical protein
MTTGYIVGLARDPTIVMYVRFTTRRRDVTNYAVLLAIEWDQTQTFRLYDSAHGFNEMHRYTRKGGKQPGEASHSGTLEECAGLSTRSGAAINQ